MILILGYMEVICNYWQQKQEPNLLLNILLIMKVLNKAHEVHYLVELKIFLKEVFSRGIKINYLQI